MMEKIYKLSIFSRVLEENYRVSLYQKKMKLKSENKLKKIRLKKIGFLKDWGGKQKQISRQECEKKMKGTNKTTTKNYQQL